MWIFLTVGFMSTVAHRTDPRLVVVRAREPAPLLHLSRRLVELGRSEPRQITMTTTDYPFRVLISREAWADFLAHEAMTITATNFKAATEDQRGHDRYTDALHAVWRVLWNAFLHLRPSTPGAHDVDPH